MSGMNEDFQQCADCPYDLCWHSRRCRKVSGMSEEWGSVVTKFNAIVYPLDRYEIQVLVDEAARLLARQEEQAEELRKAQVTALEEASAFEEMNARVVELEQEQKLWQEIMDLGGRPVVEQWRERLLAAEARVEELEAALLRIADENDPLDGIGSEMDFARRVLDSGEPE